jgi:hypothetical protein
MMNDDVQDNQLISEGKTADNPILVDCDNQGTNEASAELTIEVAGVDPNVISETHRDIAPIADYAKYDSSTSDDKSSLFPSDDSNDEQIVCPSDIDNEASSETNNSIRQDIQGINEASAEQRINVADVDPHVQSESQHDIASIANEAEDDSDEAEAVHNLQPNGITKNIDLTREEEEELLDPICAWGMDTRMTSALGGSPHFEQCAFAGMGRLLPCAHDGCSARVH